MSILIHAGLFCVASGAGYVKPIYAIETGLTSVELSLIQDKEPKVEEAQVENVNYVDDVANMIVKRQMKEKVNDSTVINEGALIESKPDYLKNPSPVYPELARQKGQQGFVLLTVQVDANGYVQIIHVKQSSGFSLLDQAAVKSVKRWKFVPAKLGSMPVAASVDVPIRFKLE